MSGKRLEETERRTRRRSKDIWALASLLALPVSAVGIHLANQAIFPSSLLRSLLGPQMREGHTSFPDYAEWDIATMILMGAVFVASAIYLLVWIIRSPLRASRRY